MTSRKNAVTGAAGRSLNKPILSRRLQIPGILKSGVINHVEGGGGPGRTF